MLFNFFILTVLFFITDYIFAFYERDILMRQL